MSKTLYVCGSVDESNAVTSDDQTADLVDNDTKTIVQVSQFSAIGSPWPPEGVFVDATLYGYGSDPNKLQVFLEWDGGTALSYFAFEEESERGPTVVALGGINSEA